MNTTFRPNSETSFPLDMDIPAQLISDSAEAGHKFIVPTVFSGPGIENTLQRLIWNFQFSEHCSPVAIVEKYLQAHNEHNKFSSARPVEDIDSAVNAKGQSALREGYLKTLGLTRLEQVLLLRGVVLATNARERESERPDSARHFSQRQADLRRVATFGIRHFSTNPISVERDPSREGLRKFVEAYSAAYIAKLIGIEVTAKYPPPNYDVCSILGAMGIEIPFRRLIDRQYDRTQSIFAVGSVEGEPTAVEEGYQEEFTPVHASDIDSTRIVELTRLRDVLGNNFSEYNFYDTVRPLQGSGIRGEAPKKKTNGRLHKLKKEADDVETNGDQEEPGGYVVLEIVSSSDDGILKKHVIAENAKIKNACYGLRQEVLDEWKNLVGVDFKWQDILVQKKEVARQLGAMKFQHSVGSNVPERVRKYLTQDLDTVVTTAFSKIFDRNPVGEKPLFDDDMNPTRFNKMPRILIREIQKSQTIKKLWPFIREYGYSETYRLIRALAGDSLEDLAKYTTKELKKVPVKSRPDIANVERLEETPSNSSNPEDVWRRVVDVELDKLLRRRS